LEGRGGLFQIPNYMVMSHNLAKKSFFLEGRGGVCLKKQKKSEKERERV
jgi:hypothetical protein